MNFIFILKLQRKEYVKYSKVFPLADVFDIKIPSKWYRRVVGGLEVGSGFAMALIPNRKYYRNVFNCYYLKNIWKEKYNIYFKFVFLSTDKIKNVGNITLLALMFLSIYNHYMVSDAFERIGPALVFTFMLTGRLVVWYQISRREAKINAAAQAQANGLKQD